MVPGGLERVPEVLEGKAEGGVSRKKWSDGRVARQRSAKPCTAVRIRFRPHRNRVADVCNAVFFCPVAALSCRSVLGRYEASRCSLCRRGVSARGLCGVRVGPVWNLYGACVWGVGIGHVRVCVGLGCGACFGAEIDLHQFLVRAKPLILSSGVAAGIARQGFRFPFAVGSLSGRRRVAIVERTKNRGE